MARGRARRAAGAAHRGNAGLEFFGKGRGRGVRRVGVAVADHQHGAVAEHFGEDADGFFGARVALGARQQRQQVGFQRLSGEQPLSGPDPAGNDERQPHCGEPMGRTDAGD